MVLKKILNQNRQYNLYRCIYIYIRTFNVYYYKNQGKKYCTYNWILYYSISLIILLYKQL